MQRSDILKQYPRYNDLMRQRNLLQKELRSIDSSIRRFEQPPVADLGMIPTVVQIMNRHFGQTISNRIRVFVLLCLFDPKAIRGGRLARGMRSRIAEALAFRCQTLVSYTIDRIRSGQMSDYDFMYQSNAVYDTVVKEMETVTNFSPIVRI